ncbi:MAG TPA: diguanylate cyclase [Gemmatimonadales bacterium]|jgi:diguanylate cyclase (GGDEF)-like protein|nr:diguanylate cyclase [Gemmatimonadales bacterium]
MRERVFLFGDASCRPEGLERALVRAGFALAEGQLALDAVPSREGDAADAVPLPDLVLLAVRDEGLGLEQSLARFRTDRWGAVPVIVLLGSSDRGGVARALSLGAADALASPINLAELCARLESRLRSGAEMRRAAGAGALQEDLFRSIQEIASARRPEEMLELLVHRLGTALGAAHCVCLAPSADRRYARLIAVHENPTLRDVAVDLFRYPEAVEAAVSGRTVHAPEVLRDGLFLAHLAQWPDSPEVHEVESAAAVPLITHRAVRAVLVIRTRRGERALLQEQVTLVEQLVNATGALLEREERRAEQSRRQVQAASTDPLTGCASLDALDRRLREECERVRRYGSQLAFALLDVDALRELNTRLGTAVGDRFLAELGGMLLQEIRTPDFVARYGSDEFALLMPATGVEGARRLLARIAARLAEHHFEDLVLAEHPRLAAGLVIFPHQGLNRVEDVLGAAETALIRGKTTAEDRVGLMEPVAA